MYLYVKPNIIVTKCESVEPSLNSLKIGKVWCELTLISCKNKHKTYFFIKAVNTVSNCHIHITKSRLSIVTSINLIRLH